MRIVDRATFLTLPAGTVYSEIQDWLANCEGLFIKDESIEESGEDYRFTAICDPTNAMAVTADIGVTASSALKKFQQNPDLDIPLDFSVVTRDGDVQNDKKFVIWSAQDIISVISLLQKGLKVHQDLNN